MKNSAGSAAAQRLRRNGTGKLCGPVENVVAWAWREELPKMPKAGGPGGMAGGWDKAGRFGELLSLIDLYGVNEFGAVPDFSADRWPCADAQLIGQAVMDLDGFVLELPEDWRPAPELDGFGGLGVKAVAAAWRKMTRDGGAGQVLRLKPSDLIIRRAVLGIDVEAMAIDVTEQKFEAWPNGEARWFIQRTVDTIVGSNPDGSDRTQPELVEHNGWNSKTRRPLPGAYRKPYLDPDPVGAIIARAEHEIWLSAMAMVFDAVAHRMTDIEMLPCAVPVAPWLDHGRPARVLIDLRAEQVLIEAEREGKRQAFARRFPVWFRRLEKMAGAPA